MGQIRILPDQVANQIAAGEVVDRPASVVKELLENALDAGAMRIRVEVEGGGRKLIRVSDDGHGMNRDDALLAFERHATSKLRTADDLLSIATLGFRGEALPSIASVARVTLETATGDEAGRARASRSPAAKFIALKTQPCRAEPRSPSPISSSTRRRGANFCAPNPLSWPTSPRWSRTTRWPILRSTSSCSRPATPSSPRRPSRAPPSASYQIFGKETLGQLLPVAAETPLERVGPARAASVEKEIRTSPPRQPGTLRLTGFYSKPELQKLNRNSIYIFVNKRLIRDRLLLHAITEAYRNVIPPTSFPVVLLFLEMPPEEVDVNVHPAKTEVRFRQQSLVHDFVRDSLRTALIKARPAAGFLAALDSQPTASPSLMPPAASPLPGAPDSDPSCPIRRRTFSSDSAHSRLPSPARCLSTFRASTARKTSLIASPLATSTPTPGAKPPALCSPRQPPTPAIAAQTPTAQQLTATIPPQPRQPPQPSSRPSRPPTPSTGSARSNRSGSCAIRSFWPPAKTACGSSTSMLHTNGCFLRRSCATARWNGCSASAC